MPLRLKKLLRVEGNEKILVERKGHKGRELKKTEDSDGI